MGSQAEGERGDVVGRDTGRDREPEQRGPGAERDERRRVGRAPRTRAPHRRPTRARRCRRSRAARRADRPPPVRGGSSGANGETGSGHVSKGSGTSARRASSRNPASSRTPSTKSRTPTITSKYCRSLNTSRTEPSMPSGNHRPRAATRADRHLSQAVRPAVRAGTDAVRGRRVGTARAPSRRRADARRSTRSSRRAPGGPRGGRRRRPPRR